MNLTYDEYKRRYTKDQREVCKVSGRKRACDDSGHRNILLGDVLI